MSSKKVQNPYGCGDNSCVFLLSDRPKGMRTNGGCRCLPNGKLTPADRVQLRNAIVWTIKQIYRDE